MQKLLLFKFLQSPYRETSFTKSTIYKTIYRKYQCSGIIDFWFIFFIIWILAHNLENESENEWLENDQNSSIICTVTHAFNTLECHKLRCDKPTSKFVSFIFNYYNFIRNEK